MASTPRPSQPRRGVKAEWMLNDLVMPRLGSRPINELSAPEILAVLRRIEGARPARKPANRVKWAHSARSYATAVATGRAEARSHR